MTIPVFATIAAGGFAAAFLHAAIPTHWLPFVLVARAQGWHRARTLAVTVVAGAGHVVLTSVLGAGVVWLGLELDKHFSTTFPLIAGGVLVGFGVYYLWRQATGRGGHSHLGHHHHAHEHGHHHHHGHDHHDPEHHHEHHFSPEHTHDEKPHTHSHDDAPCEVCGLPEEPLLRRSDWAAIASLFAMLAFSPCEGFLPVYLSGIQYGWMGFALLSLILAGGTLAGMVLFTWLALLGMEKLELKFIERWEAGLLGGLLCVLGVLVVILEQ